MGWSEGAAGYVVGIFFFLFFFFFFFCDLLGEGGSEINNPWSRGGSYIFRHMGVRIQFSYKNLGTSPQRPPYSYICTFYLFSPKILLARAENFSIFFSGCLDHSVNLKGLSLEFTANDQGNKRLQ